MNSLKNISRRNLWPEMKTRLQSSVASTSSQIQIPPRKHREPTDILKALESTISKDPGAAHYKYHDDPFLIPLSKMHQRTYAMAREAGKKAAIWIHKEHADLFQKNLAEPEIKAFQPPVIYSDKSQVSEKLLLEMISTGNLVEVLNIYNLLNHDVSNKAKQDLLELLCFYNNRQISNEKSMEERWFQGIEIREKNVWRNNPEIDKLFKDLTNEDDVAVVAAAYNALICGTAKHFNVQKAWALYTECREKNLTINLNSYNHLLEIVPVLAQGDVKPRELVKELFDSMAAEGVKPNVRTLNAALKTASLLPSNHIAIPFLKLLLSEFKRLDIKKSLASYYYTLIVLSRKGDKSYSAIMDILHSLEGKTFDIQHSKDADFFVAAMEIASQLFCDRNAGETVQNILSTGDNYKFLTNSFDENMYFRGYMLLILATNTIQEFFEIYRKLVPNIYIPEPSVMKDILKALEAYPPNVVEEYLPKIWSDIIVFNHVTRITVITDLLNLMRCRCSLSPDSPLHITFADAAWTIWATNQDLNRKQRQHLIYEAKFLGDIAILLLRANYLDQTAEVLTFMTKQLNVTIGLMQKEQIDELFKTCVLNAYSREALIVLEYCIKNGFDNIGTMARNLKSSGQLNESEQAELISLVGSGILELGVSDEESSLSTKID